MRVAYFLGNLTQASGGVFNYSVRLLDEAIELAATRQIELIVVGGAALRGQPRHSGPEQVAVARGATPQPATPRSTSSSFLPSALRNSLDRAVSRLRPYVPQAVRSFVWNQRIRQLNVDLIHVPIQVPPFDVFPVPTIITMHDVQELHFPEYFAPETRAWRAKHHLEALRQAAMVAVSFDHVKQDLYKYFDVAAERVSIVPLPYRSMKRPTLTIAVEEALADEYSDLNSFLLYPAQAWPHKNHLVLIDVFERVAQERQEPLDLVLCGHKNPEFYPEVEARARRSPFSQRIHLLGTVPDDSLTWLYSRASLVVIPTLYEAGSMPVIEAMAQGAPVICSNVTSLPETIGDPRFVFDPNDTDAIVRSIHQHLSDEQLRKANIENGHRRFAALARTDTQNALWTLWNRALEHRRRGDWLRSRVS